MLAVMGGHRETVEHILENGGDVNLVNSDKVSPGPPQPNNRRILVYLVIHDSG